MIFCALWNLCVVTVVTPLTFAFITIKSAQLSKTSDQIKFFHSQRKPSDSSRKITNGNLLDCKWIPPPCLKGWTSGITAGERTKTSACTVNGKLHLILHWRWGGHSLTYLRKLQSVAPVYIYSSCCFSYAAVLHVWFKTCWGMNRTPTSGKFTTRLNWWI